MKILQGVPRFPSKQRNRAKTHTDNSPKGLSKKHDLKTFYPKVAIVILNWNGKKDTIKCLESVFRLNYKNYKVIVVDNGSTDGSQDEIRKKFPAVKLIENSHNLGFAKGSNIGIKEAFKLGAKYVFSLNNDTTVEPDCLLNLVEVAERDTKIGTVQSKILKMDNPNIIDSTGHIFKCGRIIDRGHNKFDKGQYDNKPDIVGGCAGACLYRRKMLEEIGLFDESFGTYYEDAELSWRAYKKGWKARYVPSAIVYHKGRGSTRKSKELSQKMHLLNSRNRVWTVKRHGTLSQRFLFSFCSIMIWIKSKIRKRLRKNKVVRGFYFGLKEFMIGGRK